MNNKEMEVLNQQMQTVHAKIELLDNNDNMLEELQGICIDGSIDLDSDSIIRRTCSLNIILKDSSYLPLPDNKIWMDKKFKLLIGIENNISDEIVWFNKGVYYFDSPSVSYSQDSKTISFTGLDKMCWLDGTYNGSLGYITKINAETPIFDAIKSLLSIVGETKYIINDVEDMVIPYDLEESETATVSDFLTEIRDLYMGYEFFYNEDGYFVYQKIKQKRTDMVEWVFDEDTKCVISYANTPDWSNVKNRVLIWGMQGDDGSQISYELKNQNDNNFSIDAIGEKLLVVSEDTIQTLEQAISRAEYELWIHSSLNEEVIMDTIALYGIDVNKLITINKEEVGVEGNYRITKLSYSLGSGIMNVNCVKMYY